MRLSSIGPLPRSESALPFEIVAKFLRSVEVIYFRYLPRHAACCGGVTSHPILECDLVSPPGEGVMAIEIGQRIPDLILPDLDGRPVELHAYRGRKVILFTWASW